MRPRLAAGRPDHVQFQRPHRRQRAVRRAYQDAPVSPLFYDDRRQALAFEKLSGRSARRAITSVSGRRWMPTDEVCRSGSASAMFDDGVGVSHFTGQVTHHTAPDIDAERDLLALISPAQKMVRRVFGHRGRTRPSSPATAAAIPISPTAKSPSPTWSQAARAGKARRALCPRRRGLRRKTPSSPG